MEDIDESANGDSSDDEFYFVRACVCVRHARETPLFSFLFEGAMLTGTRPAEIGKLTTLQPETVRN
jgi:hypothetical protein